MTKAVTATSDEAMARPETTKPGKSRALFWNHLGWLMGYHTPPKQCHRRWEFLKLPHAPV
jgi:hypothetical protein